MGHILIKHIVYMSVPVGKKGGFKGGLNKLFYAVERHFEKVLVQKPGTTKETKTLNDKTIGWYSCSQKASMYTKRK